MLVDVEAGAGELVRLQHAHQRILVDHLAACGVDDDGGGLHQLQPPRRQQVIGRGRVRAVDRDDVHARQHLVEAFPVGGIELALDIGVQALAVVIVDGKAETSRAPGQRLADAAHADDAHALAQEPCAQHRGRTPAAPLVGPHHALARAHAARRGQHQRHRHVGCVLGQHARRVGDGDAAMARGVEIDMVDAGAERGDQLELRTGLAQHAAVDAVGDGRHQYVRGLHRLDELRGIERLVVGVQPGVE